MSYRAITDRGSKQWRLQRKAYTDSEGFRRLGKRYMVAMGTYYTSKVGKVFRITLDSGKTFEVVIGDIKQDIHTDPRHQYARKNKDILEFIVDTRKLSTRSRNLGNVVEFSGRITKIEEMGARK